MRAYLSKHRWHFWAAIGRAIDTDRWQRLCPIMGGDCTPLPNVWLGVSVEDQKRADERIPDLLATPAAVRFLSCEPLLGPVDLRWIAEPDEEKDGVIDALLGCNWIDGTIYDRGEEFRPARPGHQDRVMRRWVCSPENDILANRKIDWVIVGGESGPAARPMHPDWARSLRDQCAAAGVPFFFKQWGEWMPAQAVANENNGVDFVPPLPMTRLMPWRRWDGDECRAARKGESVNEFFQPGILAVPVGKKRAGRLLDGVTHDAMPQVMP
jgi:protein gp37